MIDVVVSRKEVIAEDVCLFEFKRPDGGAMPAFSAGAHIDVHLAHGLTRQYSLCNPPDETHRYIIAVLREPKSRGGSLTMYDKIWPGDLLRIGSPRNHFPLNEGAGRTVLFAGGIGITPILCMAERLKALSKDFEIHYCARTQSRLAFHDYMAAEFRDRLQFHVDDGEEGQRLRAGQVLSTPAADTHLYVCGPAPFIAHIFDAASAHGWTDACLHKEYFGAPPAAADESGSFEIQIASNGQVLRVGEGQRVLDVLIENGIDIPYSCEQGICGTCMVKVISGIPDHRDMFMTDAERACNDRFTPCCSRSLGDRLVLDL